MRTEPRRRGFSQVELLIAVGVLAVGILGVCATFGYALRAETHAGRLSEATGHARQLVELIRVRNLPFQYDPGMPPADSGLNDTASQRRPLNGAPFASDLPASTGLSRNIRIERVSTDTSDYRYNLARVTVTVYWQDRGGEKRVQLVSVHRRP